MLSLPSPPGIPDLRASDDTGNSSTDNITYQTKDLSFFWSAGSGASRYYYAWDNSAPQSTYATNSGVTLDAPNGQGPHVLYVRSWNTSGYSAATSLNVYIDQRVPILSGLNLRESDDTGYSNSDNITSDTSVRFFWASNPNGGSGIRQFHFGWNPNNLSNTTVHTYADVSPPLNNGRQSNTVRHEIW